MQTITPFLWFDTQAEEAMNFYVSVFKNSEAGEIMRVSGEMPGEPGSVLSVTFKLEGQEFYALNGGPTFQFNPAVSLFVSCETQEEIDDLWGKLTTGGGKPVQCGWLTDKYGLSWQIVPSALREMLWGNDHPENSTRAYKALMGMTKLDIGELKRAFNGE